MSRSPRTHRRYALLAASAVVLAPLAGAVSAARAETSLVTLVGSLQSELGCAADWDPACAATELVRQGTSAVYTTTFEVPAGSYEFKVALNGGWDENYGAGGARDGANLPLVLQGPARIAFSYDDTSHIPSLVPLTLAGERMPSDKTYAGDSLRSSLTRERFYFVMADRFANGSRANDAGGLTGGPLTTGLDPTNKAFYHGGDLAGLTDKLDYIASLGTTAIWLTPSFKNKPVQGGAGQESAGYHGYWVTDFTQIDPHLGTNAEMKALIDAAHAKGMKVFFDIITNHTADVIDFQEKQYSYRSKEAFPYKDAAGNPFDDQDYINKPFPAMDPATSFPYTPFYPNPGDATLRKPAWLNDITMYHNRGDSVWAGESNTYGDFIGLDDLFTERPEVVQGMGGIYKTWVDFGIDGFRIDTVKHVNLEFWQKFIPNILGEAKRIGNDDFFAFGEVYDSSPEYLSTFTTKGTLQATLDFGFQAKAVDFAKGKAATGMADLYAKDDYYIDRDSNAYQLPTFLGNHDMGRVAMFLQGASASDDEHMARVKLADSLMYLTRGNPVTYYGDEQGFIGTGGDQLARQDMFASQVDIYNGEKVLGGSSGSKARFDRTHPLYRHIKGLSALRAAHPALADGMQVTRYAADGPGLFAMSRLDRPDGRWALGTEYLVVANNATTPQTATFDTWTSRGAFAPLYGGVARVTPGASGEVTVTVPPLSVGVWRATQHTDRPVAAPSVTVASPTPGAIVGGRAEVRATLGEDTPSQVSFLYRPVGTSTWTRLGTDDNAPYRVFHDVSGMPFGTVLEYRVIAKDQTGAFRASSTWGVVGKPAPVGGGGSNDPVTQPGAVSVPGTHNSEMGCTGGSNAGDWMPECDLAQLTLDPQSGIWKGTWTMPAGQWSYKAAIDRSWDENYGEGGVLAGGNIAYETTAEGPVSFYYDHATHWVTSSAEDPLVTAPGNFQSELGCNDWQPECMRPWLQDPDGDGTYTFTTKLIPAGSYEGKVAHGLSWAENYGAGGVFDGPNIAFTVPADGATTTFTYDVATHILTVTSS